MYIKLTIHQKNICLLKEGMNLNSNPPQYYVSNIDKYKLNMLSLALADAKMRANEIAKELVMI